MSYQVTSSKTAIGRVIRDFQMQDESRIYDMYEYVQEALEFMEHHAGFEDKDCVLTIKNHRAALPQELYQLDLVEVAGRAAVPSLDRTGRNIDSGGRTTGPKPAQINQNGMPFLVTDPNNPADPISDNFMPLGEEQYWVEGPYLKFEQESGTAKIYYQAHRVDDCGLPMIPNTIWYKEAIFWYIAYRLMLSGVRHPNPRISMEYCEQKWSDNAQAAANDIQFPSVPDMESFKRSWIRMAPNPNEFADFFLGLNNSEKNRV